MRMTLMCAAGLLALTGCGGGEEGADGNAAANGNGAAGNGEQTVEIRPGQWEITAEIPTEGMPPEIVAAMGGGKVTTRQCVTPEEAQASAGELFSSEQAGNCTPKDVSAGGGRMRGTMTCSGEDGGPTSVEVEGSYDAETYEMTQKMTLAGGETSELRITGRRIGECPADAAAPEAGAAEPQPGAGEGA